MFVFYFGFTYLSPLGLSHWASTSWQEASLGKRKQTPLRLPLCVCLCVLVLAHTHRQEEAVWLACQYPFGRPTDTEDVPSSQLVYSKMHSVEVLAFSYLHQKPLHTDWKTDTHDSLIQCRENTSLKSTIPPYKRGTASQCGSFVAVLKQGSLPEGVGLTAYDKLSLTKHLVDHVG